jgi:hypothetical protein
MMEANINFLMNMREVQKRERDENAHKEYDNDDEEKDNYEVDSDESCY